MKYVHGFLALVAVYFGADYYFSGTVAGAYFYFLVGYVALSHILTVNDIVKKEKMVKVFQDVIKQIENKHNKPSLSIVEEKGEEDESGKN